MNSTYEFRLRIPNGATIEIAGAEDFVRAAYGLVTPMIAGLISGAGKITTLAAPALPAKDTSRPRPVAARAKKRMRGRKILVTMPDGTERPMSANEAAKLLGVAAASVKVACSPTGQHKAGGAAVRWADSVPENGAPHADQPVIPQELAERYGTDSEGFREPLNA